MAEATALIGVPVAELATLLDDALNTAEAEPRTQPTDDDIAIEAEATPQPMDEPPPDEPVADDVLILDEDMAVEPEADPLPVDEPVGEDVLILDDEMAVDEPVAEDVLILDDNMAVEPEPDPSHVAELARLASAFLARESDTGSEAPPPEPASDDTAEDVLVLDDEMEIEPEADPLPIEEPVAEDVLILDDTMAVEPEPDSSHVAELARLASAFLARESDTGSEAPPPEPASDDTADDILILDDAATVQEAAPQPMDEPSEDIPSAEDVLVLDDEMAIEPEADPLPVDEPVAEDVLILDDTMAVEPEPDSGHVAELARLASAFLARESDAPPAEPASDDTAADVQIPDDAATLEEREPASDEPEPDDVLVLDDHMAVEPVPEAWAATDDVLVPANGTAAETEAGSGPEGWTDTVAAPEHTGESPSSEATIVALDDAFLAALPPYEQPAADGDQDPLVTEPEPQPEPGPEPEPEPEPESEPEPEPAPAAIEPVMPDTGEVAQMVAVQLATYGVAGEENGDHALPERLDVLVQLLAEPPPGQDFEALDMLYTCWPKTTTRSTSRALLAVALNLSSRFGLPGRLPMASSKAWRMLDPEVFETDLAQRLLGIGEFISGWQRQQSTFLILEFGEIELIEYLFEALPPGRYMDLLANVMNFKVLSNRRMGLLRRIPTRLKKQVQPMLPARRDEALLVLAHSKALLDNLSQPPGFPPLMETAARMAEEVEKVMKASAAAGQAPAAPSSGSPLGKIG